MSVTGTPARNPRILLVDDRPENLLALEATLQDLPIDIDSTESGRNALKKLLTNDYAAILLDAYMPEMDGFETARLIKQRERTSHIPIIFLTAGSDDRQLTLRGYQAGAVDYLTKPFDPWILRSKVSIFAELWNAHEKTRDLNAQLQTVNAQLQTQTEELARSNRALEEFAYAASHDLQEPLRKISGFCQLLRSRYRGRLDDRADQYIDFAVDGASRMSQLIKDLLAYSRVERIPSRQENVNAHELVNLATQQLAGQIEDTNARITCDTLPQVRGEVSVLAMVFQNMISNAIKFRSQAPPHIHITAERRGPLWQFSVQDNGIGIDPGFAEKIFVIFQRLHAKDSYPGTGIGLAISRKIIEYHGGTIWLGPQPGPGATFFFTLPAADTELRADTDPAHAH
jgi:signal transduction histidine kinase